MADHQKNKVVAAMPAKVEPPPAPHGAAAIGPKAEAWLRRTYNGESDAKKCSWFTAFKQDPAKYRSCPCPREKACGKVGGCGFLHEEMTDAEWDRAQRNAPVFTNLKQREATS